MTTAMLGREGMGLDCAGVCRLAAARQAAVFAVRVAGRVAATRPCLDVAAFAVTSSRDGTCSPSPGTSATEKPSSFSCCW